MSAERPVQQRDVPKIESEIRAFVRQESSRQESSRQESSRQESSRQESTRQQADREGDDGVGGHVPDLIQRVAGSSVTEIDRLIAELTQLRDHLQREGKRMETEIAAFAQTGQAAVSSIKEITQTLGRFKRAARLTPGQ